MTNEIKKKGDDGESASILIVLGGIFSLALILVDSFYGNMQALMHSWVKVPFIILHLLALAFWYGALKSRKDPNIEWTRWALALTLVAALLLVLSHRAGFVSDKMYNDDVDKSKQEQNGK